MTDIIGNTALLDNYKIRASLIPPDQMAKLPMKEALELIDYIHKISLALVEELDIHQTNIKHLADIVKNSVNKK
jgi:hypothetical protein